MGAAPIYLHSSWRAASTYVWAKFRRLAETYCYFEPLNEHLEYATGETVDRFVPWPFARHPPLDAPYLEEYRPLLTGDGGVPGFPVDLVFGHYCAGPGEDLPALEGYMAMLTAQARLCGRRPVFGFVRSDLRISWFRARLPGVHIFIRRDPRRQFLSMLAQAVKGNPYFLQRGLVILHENLDAPAFTSLISAIELPTLVASSELREVFQGKIGRYTPLPKLYAIFYYQRLLAQRGESLCDLVLDIDRLSLDATYRHEMEDRVGALTDLALAFDDCRVERYDTNLSWSSALFESLERDIEVLIGNAEIDLQLR